MISHVRAIAPQPKLMVQLSRSGISWAPTTLPLKISAFTFQIALFLNFNLSNCWLYHPSKPTVTMSPKDFICPKLCWSFRLNPNDQLSPRSMIPWPICLSQFPGPAYLLPPHWPKLWLSHPSYEPLELEQSMEGADEFANWFECIWILMKHDYVK